MADDERRDEEVDNDGAQEGSGEDEESAGRDSEDQPAEVQGEETVVEDEATREQTAEPEDSGGDDETPEQTAEPEDSGGDDETPEQTAEPEGSGGDRPEASEERGRDRKSRDRPSGDGESKREAVPGAELEPIAIEPERELSAEERARLEAEAEERARREAEATAEEGEEPAVERHTAVDLPAESRIQATGKRKTSIARVVVRSGDGKFEVNERTVDEYFPRPYLRTVARQALVTTGYEDALDVRVRVHGGGISGQAGAVRHGVARALVEIDPELRGELKRRGLLTRDARAKERRKAGLKKARKRPQFSKR